MSEIDIEWLQATLQDANDALSDVVAAIQDSPDEETALDLLRHDLVHVYAKLNYAVNTARLGPDALNALTEDELIAWPMGMPFLSWAEVDEFPEDDANAETEKTE